MVVRHYDHVILGAGIAGMGVAAELARAGQRVIVLDQEGHAPYHASGRAAALFAASYSSCFDITALTKASASFFREPPAGFSPTKLSDPMPALYVADRDVEQLDLCQVLFEDALKNGADVSYIDDPAELQRMAPMLRPDRAQAAVCERDAMYMDIHALHEGYRRMLLDFGGDVLVNAQVTDMWEDCSGMVAVHTGSAIIYAEKVVDATGAWGDITATWLGGTHLNLRPLRRTVVIAKPTNFALPAGDVAGMPFVFSVTEDLYFRVENGNFLISPADETLTVAGDAQPEELDVATALARFEAMTTVKVAPRLVKTWAGLRTFAPDNKPVVGFDPRNPRLFRLLGHGGYGIQTAPALSRLAASLVLEKGVPSDLADLGLTAKALSPERFQRGAQLALVNS